MLVYLAGDFSNQNKEQIGTNESVVREWSNKHQDHAVSLQEPITESFSLASRREGQNARIRPTVAGI